MFQLNKNEGCIKEEDNIVSKIKELNLHLLQNEDEINNMRQENETLSSQVYKAINKIYICMYILINTH